MKQHFIPALMALAAVFSLTQCETPAGGGRKMGGQTFTNTVGMKLVPVPGTNISMGTTEVTVAQWRASGLPYKSPQFLQDEEHPVVGISYFDAKKFCRWLSRKERRLYRLPTDQEWSYAVGIGHLENAKESPMNKCNKIRDLYPWGQGRPKGRSGNFRGEECRAANDVSCIAFYNDKYIHTAPVASYEPNKIGIYDLGGNVREWCQDTADNMSLGTVMRGSDFTVAESWRLLSSYRYFNYMPADPSRTDGFRVVCE